jgi:hypothetical protein
MPFGAITLDWLEQEGADGMRALPVDHGVNHSDVVPTYGDTERTRTPSTVPS